MTTDPDRPDWHRMPSHPDALHPAVPEEQSPTVYGSYMRPPRHHVPVVVRALGLLVLTGGGVAGWLSAQAHDLLPADSLWTPAALAGWLAVVAALYYLAIRPAADIGIALSQDMVRFGRWPFDLVEIHRSDLLEVRASSRPWTGQQLEPALKSFLVRDFRYLTLHRKDGVLFHVAIDSGNTYTDRIIDVLTGERPLRRPEPPPAPKSEARAKPEKSHPLFVSTPRPTAPDPPAPPSEPSPDAERLLWEAAIRRHDEILLAYLPYEVDPHLLMQYPTITDVTDDVTAAFLDALGEAATLRTEEFPSSESTSVAYRDRVKTLGTAWSRAERNAKKVGISQLDPGQQRKISQAARLLRHAEGADNPFERATYLQQVSKLLDELTREGAITPPPKITAEITARASLALEQAQGDPMERTQP